MAYILINDPERLSLLSLTGVTESSLELIHQHKDILLPLVGPIVDELYEQIYRVDHLKKIIDYSSTLEQLKETQRIYLTQVFCPIINDAYIKNRYKVGSVHSRIGLDLQWFISVHRLYCQIVLDYLVKSMPIKEASELMNAIESLLNFDVQIVVTAYTKIEMDKALFPLRYEFKHLQNKAGLIDQDFDILDTFNGKLTYRLEEIMKKFYQGLFQRVAHIPWKSKDVLSETEYLKNYLTQFFQEKVYRDEISFYRVIRDWVKKINQKNISEQELTFIIDLFNEAVRETFLKRDSQYEKEVITFLGSFERLIRFTLAVLRELLTPYKSLETYSFLNIFGYEIDILDFGIVTWVDDNAKRLLESQGVKNDAILGKRCYELLYNRVLPCTGCPVRHDSGESFITSKEKDNISQYFKTWQLPQPAIAELSHRLLVSQNITDETKVIFDTIESLLELAELRDDDTGKHVERIGMLAKKLAQISGCDQQFIHNIELAARFHDIGKVGIPDAILNKPGKLTHEERESMKTHSEIGHKILSKLDLPVIQMASRIANTHHEKWNGTGYPNQLKGEEIPLEGRIVAIVDVFDALLTKRAYKDPFPPEKVKTILIEGKGEHFDPNLIDVFLSMWDEFITPYQITTSTEVQ
jgi:putative two-component system response regulator